MQARFTQSRHLFSFAQRTVEDVWSNPTRWMSALGKRTAREKKLKSAALPEKGIEVGGGNVR